MSIYRILAVLITATIFFASCTKENSDVRLDPNLPEVVLPKEVFALIPLQRLLLQTIKRFIPEQLKLLPL
jgi:hypothetical protein